VNYPTGELRGQIVANPEPASYGLLLLGTGVVAMGERRRRRKQRSGENKG
jgi:hypothetical protein